MHEHDEFWYGIDGVRHGPVSLAELRRMVAAGKLGPDDFLWDEERDDWVAVRDGIHLLRLDVVDVATPGGPAAEDGGDQEPSSQAEYGGRLDARLGGPEPSGLHPVYREPAVAPYAGFGIRLAAYVLDRLVLVLPLMFWSALAAVLAHVDVAATERVLERMLLSPEHVNATAAEMSFLRYYWIGYVALDWLYNALLESSRWQATVGKRAMGLVVTDIAGYRLDFLRASLRHYSKYLSYMLFGLGFLMILVTGKKQGLHDKIAQTLVLHRR